MTRVVTIVMLGLFGLIAVVGGCRASADVDPHGSMTMPLPK